jgi:ribosomal protein S18 acetylase RimI-like enzyme
MSHTEYIKATMADIDAVVEMRMRFQNEYLGVQSGEMETLLRKNLSDYFTKELDKNYLCWFAKVNGELASIAGMVIRINPGNVRNPTGIWGYIMSVYTLPKYRRMGLSKNILDRLIETAKERGITSFELHATSDGEHMYRKAGFEKFGEPTYRKFLGS